MKRLGLVCLAVLAAGAAVYGLWGETIRTVAEAYAPGVFATTTSAAATGETGGKARAESVTPVETVAAVSEDIPIRRVTIGSVLSKASLSVTSTVQGMVIERVAREGSDIALGDVIARLDSRTAEANVAKDRATFDRDTATLDSAKSELERQKSLAGKNIVSGQALDDAETAVETATATIALDRATLAADMVTLDDMQIRAPFAGRLGAYTIAVGSIVQPGGAIVSLTQMTPVDVSFDLPEADVAALRAAMANGAVDVTVTPSTRMSATGGGAGIDETRRTGTLSFVDSQVDPQSGTFTAKATLENSDLAFWPGQSVTVDVVLGRKTLVAVPSVAVQPAQNGSIVYTVDADDKIAIRTVIVGLTDGDRTGLSSGLDVGDRVVTEGQIKLADGMRVKVVPPQGQTGGEVPETPEAVSDNVAAGASVAGATVR